MRIAIQPDTFRDRVYGDAAHSAPRWAAALEARGHEVRQVDVYRADILEQLAGCDGFLWRHIHDVGMQQIARRLLPVIERELRLCVFPDQATCWHYDDKIAQAFLLRALEIPTPDTWVWFEREDAERFAREAKVPLVMKLSTGAGSENVRRIDSAAEALEWIRILFSTGVTDLSDASFRPAPWGARVRAAARTLLHGRPAHRHGLGRGGLHHGYVLFQQLVPDNAFDTRVTVIGRRAFGFRRFNRPGDFRASGSGRLDHDPTQIDLATVRLAFETAQRMGTQSVAIDGLRDGAKPLVAEVSYTYQSQAVADCPGHWELRGAPASGELTWVAGSMWPEDAQIEDFLVKLSAASARSPACDERPDRGARGSR